MRKLVILTTSGVSICMPSRLVFNRAGHRVLQALEHGKKNAISLFQVIKSPAKQKGNGILFPSEALVGKPQRVLWLLY